MAVSDTIQIIIQPFQSTSRAVVVLADREKPLTLTTRYAHPFIKYNINFEIKNKKSLPTFS